MKKILALTLAMLLCLGLFAGCGNQTADPETEGQDNIEKVEDDGIMKILLIGHSLGVDSVFMFPDVARNEGMENLVVGFLYHSGCRVAQHLDYAKENAAQYAYYEYDISAQDEWLRADCNGNFTPCAAGAANDIYIEDGSIAQTLQFGIQRHDWDMVILQGGSMESADVRDSWYVSTGKQLNFTGYIQQLQDYVLANDIEPGSVPQFAWNMVWSSPADRAVRKDNTNTLLDTYFGGSELEMHYAQANVLKNTVAPAFDWAYIFPNGTAIQNLKSTKLTNAEIYRDYAHVTDFGRLVAAYTWYCTISGTAIEDCKIPAMNHKVLLDAMARNTGTDLVLTEEQKNILVECVGNAIKNPYTMTQSQYTA